MSDIIGDTYPPIGVSPHEFVDEATRPYDRGAGARGFSQTTRWGSGPRDWEGGREHPPVEYYCGGDVVRHQRLLAGIRVP
jgi:hypothetical protein